MSISRLRVNYWLNAIGEVASGQCVNNTMSRLALFKADTGDAMSFMLNANTGDGGEAGVVVALGRLVVACGGRLELPVSAVRLRLGRVAIMADTSIAPLAVHFDGAYTFKMKYILDCVEEGVLLNLASYIETKPMMTPRIDLSKNTNFFYDVFYWLKSKLPQPIVLDNGDNKHRSPAKCKSPEKSIMVESDENDDDAASRGSWMSCSTAAANRKAAAGSDRPASSASSKFPVKRRVIATVADSSDDDDLMSLVQEMDTNNSRRNVVDKHSRVCYSRSEKEAILKFIIAKKAYKYIKGNRLYIDMEAHNVCPSRTYQSMRNHFLKSIIKELDNFKFLLPKQKQLLRDNF